MSKLEKIIFFVALIIFLVSDIAFILNHLFDIQIFALVSDWKGNVIPLVSAAVWITVIYRYAKREKEKNEKGD